MMSTSTACAEAIVSGVDVGAGSAFTRRPASGPVFFGVAALLFIASAAATIIWSRSMPEICGMGASMAWTRMPGQTWFGAAGAFLGMWAVMMSAMMLPSLTMALWRYRRALCEMGEAHPGWLAVQAGAGYFFVWSVLGIFVYPLGVALAHAVPVAGGGVILFAGALQFTVWKTRQLACCRDATTCARQLSAWQQGLHLGLHCIRCCAGLTATLLVLGVMDLRTMALVTAAISAERLAPHPHVLRIARAIGLIVVGAGLYLIVGASSGAG